MEDYYNVANTERQDSSNGEAFSKMMQFVELMPLNYNGVTTVEVDKLVSVLDSLDEELI